MFDELALGLEVPERTENACFPLNRLEMNWQCKSSRILLFAANSGLVVLQF
jgi:hypothetical protein